MKKKSVQRVFLCLLLLLFIGMTTGAGLIKAEVLQGEKLENQVRKIADQLRCPTCQGLSVKDSEAGLSLNMKSRIREMLQEGKSENEILQFFVDRYGEWILRSPKKEGFNLILWLAPLVLIVIVGVIIIAILLKRSKQKETRDLTPLSASEKSKLEKDLKQFESD